MSDKLPDRWNDPAYPVRVTSVHHEKWDKGETIGEKKTFEVFCALISNAETVEDYINSIDSAILLTKKMLSKLEEI